MYDTAPLTPFKGETKPFLHVEIDSKTLESLFDLHPSLENSFDLSEFVSSAAVVGSGPTTAQSVAATSPQGVPDSATVTSPVASSADLVTLSSAATSQHLAEIERRTIHGGTGVSHFAPQPQSPSSVVPTTPSPVSSLHHHHHPHHHSHSQQQQQRSHHQQHLQNYQEVLSPSLIAEDVSQALSDDSCVFIPDYDMPIATTTAPSSVSGGWGYTTVKQEDMGLASLTACSLEASLPGFTSTITTASTSSSSSNFPMKMETNEMGLGYGGRYSASVTATVLSPIRSSRTLSESSTATTSTIPDSPRRLSKGGSKRRQVPKGSEEYKEKRARNNVAVRKSRAKAKEKQRMTEGRVKELLDANEALTKKVEMLTKELTVLRGLFVNVGAQLPDDFSKLLEQS
jgi:hypothetical protein